MTWLRPKTYIVQRMFGLAVRVLKVTLMEFSLRLSWHGFPPFGQWSCPFVYICILLDTLFLNSSPAFSRLGVPQLVYLFL